MIDDKLEGFGEEFLEEIETGEQLGEEVHTPQVEAPVHTHPVKAAPKKRTRRSPAQVAADKAKQEKAEEVFTISAHTEKPAPMTEYEKADLLRAIKLELGNLNPDMQTEDYAFLSLPELRRLIDPLLSKVGLVLKCASVVSPMHGNYIGYFLINEYSEQISSALFPFPVMTHDVRDFGAAVTYIRRYALLVLFDLIVEDKDGVSNQRVTKRTAPAPADKLVYVPAVHEVKAEAPPVEHVMKAEEMPTHPHTPAAKEHEPRAEWEIYGDLLKKGSIKDPVDEQVKKYFGYVKAANKADRIQNPAYRRGFENLCAGKMTKLPEEKVLEGARDMLILILKGE